MVESTKDTGNRILGVERGTSTIRRGICIEDSLQRGEPMEGVYSLGITERYMMENGKTDIKMGMECGKGRIMILMLESGRSQELMGMASTYGHQVIGMRESGSTVSRVDKEQTSLPMEIRILENIRMVGPMERVSINGPMVAIIMDSLSKDSSMARGNGTRMKGRTLPIMTESITKTRNRGMEPLNGLVGTSTMETSRMMRDMVRGLWSGLMAVSTLVIGLEGSNMDMES